MTLPIDYNTVPVTGRYVYLDGTPAVGTVRFTGKVAAVSDAYDTVILPGTISVPLDSNGSLSVNLPATDDPDIQPNGWTYRVEERFNNGGGRTYDIDVPYNSAGIDLSEVAPVTPDVGDPTAFVTLSAFEASTTSLESSVADTEERLDNAFNRIFYARDFGAVFDGVTDDTLAIQTALNAAFIDGSSPSGGIVILSPGITRISATLVIPPYVTLRGSYPMRGSNTQESCIKTLDSFAGNAIIQLLDNGLTGWTTLSYGQRIKDVTLDGLPSKATATFSGIRGEGNVRGVILQDVSITNCSDRGVTTATYNSKRPYSWQLENVQVADITLDGFRLSGTTDTTLIGCRAIGIGRHGFYVDGMANSSFSQCRAEWCKGNGWYVTAGWGTGTGSGGAMFNQCSTDRCDLDGFKVDATGTPPLIFANCYARRDGRNNNVASSNYAGFQVTNATTPIIITGLAVFPGVDDDGSGLNTPHHGVRVSGSTWVNLDSGYIHGANAHVTDGGTNTAFIVGANVGKATGTTSAPTRV